MPPLNASERAQLERYLTNLDRPVFALRNLPEVVKGALFSRYSRTEKSLRRVLLDEFLQSPDLELAASAEDAIPATDRAEDFYQRVLVGYGDDSVAELAGAHIAVEQVSTLAAKALEDSRIGISPLEKSTRYVRFDRRDDEGRFLYHRGPELSDPAYVAGMDGLFSTYSDLITPLTEAVRERHPMEEGEAERGWKAATRARALDLLRGLLPAATLTNVGLYGNGRAFEYLLTKLTASELPECAELAESMHRELSEVIPAFVRRARDERYGGPAADRLRRMRQRMATLAPPPSREPAGTSVRLIEHDPDAERKVVAAALFPHGAPLDAVPDVSVEAVMEALLADRQNRRQKAPRALEHASYTFEIVANFGAYRDLHRHRMLTQDRQYLGSWLGYDLPEELAGYGIRDRVGEALEEAGRVHRTLASDLGEAVAQYAVPLAYRVRWYFRASLREIYHLCELRTTPQGHPDYRFLAQEMFRRVAEVHPALAAQARFVDLSAGDELERRASERRTDDKLRSLQA
ncbi:MAG TPA: FAD-dependent thymidylate synthase [Candidatus Dormibacteraeota bacterium]|nr:FAD-dependent thymidylate synthase [Candidatus Dormibacteraeota bacterium]